MARSSPSLAKMTAKDRDAFLKWNAWQAKARGKSPDLDLDVQQYDMPAYWLAKGRPAPGKYGSGASRRPEHGGEVRFTDEFKTVPHSGLPTTEVRARRVAPSGTKRPLGTGTPGMLTRASAAKILAKRQATPPRYEQSPASASRVVRALGKGIATKREQVRSLLSHGFSHPDLRPGTDIAPRKEAWLRSQFGKTDVEQLSPAELDKAQSRLSGAYLKSLERDGFLLDAGKRKLRTVS